MQIQWKDKWLSFNAQGHQVKLQGISDDVQPCTEVTLNQLSAMERDDAVWGIVQVYDVQPDLPSKPKLPPEIQNIIKEFDSIFQPIPHLPPQRPKDHTIPLISGAQPFRLRPYRYNPF